MTTITITNLDRGIEELQKPFSKVDMEMGNGYDPHNVKDVARYLAGISSTEVTKLSYVVHRCVLIPNKNSDDFLSGVYIIVYHPTNFEIEVVYHKKSVSNINLELKKLGFGDVEIYKPSNAQIIDAIIRYMS